MHERLKETVNGQKWLLAFVAIVSLILGGGFSAAIGHRQYEGLRNEVKELRAQYESERLSVRDRLAQFGERVANIEAMVTFLYEREKSRTK